MARLIDYFNRSGQNRLGPDLQVVIGDEVLAGIDNGPDRTWAPEHFPNVAPPFPMFMVEAHSAINKYYLGAIFADLAHYPDMLPQPEDVPLAPDTHWRLLMLGLSYNENWGLTVYPAAGVLHIGKDGTWLDERGEISYVSIAGVDYGQFETAVMFMRELVPMSLMTISMLHCKNVTLIENEPPPKLAQKAERRYGHPLHSFHTLTIRPMSKQRQDGGGVGHSESILASHIRRGHFKTFDDAAPLFGKWTGTYWWESHVAGRKDHGEVGKNYRVKPE